MTWVSSLIDAGIEISENKTALTSNWGSLSARAMATITPCTRQGKLSSETAVRAPFSDASISAGFNWRSPFEDVGTENAHPTIAAMLQSNVLGNLLLPEADAGDSGGLIGGLSSLLKKGEGRSGITKLNSTQVFVGNEPLKIEGTLIFRAYADPVTEVTQPIERLFVMAHPAKIATLSEVKGDLTSVVRGVMNGDFSDGTQDAAVNVLFPSVAPSCVALKYRNLTYKPLVIESISRPLCNPGCALGDVFATVSVSFGTLTAWDAGDFRDTASDVLGKLAKESAEAASSLFK